jgi:hypothetical protein
VGGARLPLKGVDVRRGPLFAEIGADDGQVGGDPRLAVELEGRAVDSRVISPFQSAGLAVEGSIETVAGTDQNLVSRDRGSGEDSAAGLGFPVKGTDPGSFVDW